ncbi:MAG: hypothetical protein WC136_09720 [Sphaerochaeta sp.]|nr:hypothetical protein [Sphaerochaeta sp.]
MVEKYIVDLFLVSKKEAHYAKNQVGMKLTASEIGYQTKRASFPVLMKNLVNLKQDSPFLRCSE